MRTHIDPEITNVPIFDRRSEMNIKLIRNAMFITVIIMVISLMGKTSAHDVRASHVIQPSNNVQLMIER